MLKIKFLKVFLLFSCLSFSNFLQAQSFGNEWIIASQKYVKIKISEEGLFGIDLNQIIQSGLATQNIDPKKFQLFNKGKEVAILVTGDSDNVFDGNDKIVFYGKPNDASLDKVLYNNPADLPNDEVSLYENDNYYFLTYSNNTTGLRLKEFQQNNTGLTEENWIIAKSRINLTDGYYPGEFILSAMSLSEYIEGEGFMGNTFGKGQTTNLSLNTLDIASSSFQPQLSFYVAGRSNASSTNVNGFNHHLRVSLNNATVFDTLFRGYKTVRKTLPITLNTNNNQIGFSSIDDLGALTDFQAISYAEITYARGTNINNLSSLKFILNNSKAISFLRFRNSGLATPILWDLTTDFIIRGVKNTTNADFVINTTNQQKNYFLADLDNLKSTNLTPTTFRNFLTTDVKSFLMISNKLLTAGANNYKTYNDTRNIETTIAYTDDLYNEFYYGFHHPLALKNFCAWAISRGNTKPEYLLLLGKGMEISKGNFNNDLVPTMGYPASDNMLTSGLNGSNLEPGLATGRVPAKTNEEVENYLNKLKVYEKLPNEIWRKNILFLNGGRSSSENTSYTSFQNSLFRVAEGEFFGAKASVISKDVNNPVTENQTQRIINETASGVSLVSFLGHGSSTETEISFGPTSSHRNKEKPTVYIVNGCSTGAIFGSNLALGEQFLLAKDVGAVAWIGTTSEGVASYLTNATRYFYSNWFKNMYGKSISDGIKNGLRSYQVPSDRLNTAHTRQYIYIGDPLISFYKTENPDYTINNSDISYDNSSVNAVKDLELQVIIKNLAKAVNTDSLSIKIERILPNNTNLLLPILKIKSVLNTDTVKIIINNNIQQNIVGNNRILITLNPENTIPELNLNNNQGQLSLFISGNGINTIYPRKNGIVSTSNNFILKVQSENLFTQTAEYIFEIDTISTFTSTLKKTSPIISSGLFADWNPGLILENGKVYFWRARLNLPQDQGGNWVTSVFTYLNNGNDGFSLSHKDQLKDLKFEDATFDYNTGLFKFKPTFFPTSIQTEGDDGGAPFDKRFRTTQTISFSSIGFVGLTLVAYHPVKIGKKFSYPSPYNSNSGPPDEYDANGFTGQYFWNTNIPEQVDSLISYLNQVPEGYYVIGYNGLNTTINALPSAAKNALQSIGLNKYDLINTGEPYMFWGIKGASPGSVLEFTADYSSNIPPRAQRIRHAENLKYSLSSGYINTDLIGPAKEWKNAELKYFSNQNDKISYELRGINQQGIESVLQNNLNTDEIDLSQINAKEYPFIKIKSTFEDKEDYNIPKLNFWRVNFNPIAELTLNPTFTNNFYKEKIQEGDSVKWELGVTNLANISSDSLELSYTIRKANNTSIIKTLKREANLNPGESKKIMISEATQGLVGINTLRAELKLNSSSDLYTFNNTIFKNFEVLKDSKQPLLDILFDGRPIVNGEIISPEPIINITLKDENKFLLLNDTSYLSVFIRKEEETNFRRVYYATGQLNLVPANNGEENKLTVEYKPSRLSDGKYTMKVSSKDASNNTNQNDYEITFEVINESSISNFYPYPNPVTTAMKFVFTLTGDKIPEKVKIQILTVSGKVVREISKEELGALRIGNNVSDFTWDGTDQFGDRLANGVYFYKVMIQDNELGDLKHRSTKGDQFFRNKIGKIYLMR